MKTERGTHPTECYRCKETIPAGTLHCRTLVDGYFQRLHLACAQALLAERPTAGARHGQSETPRHTARRA